MITRFNRDVLAKNLPDAYRKDPASNNAKILEIEKRTSDTLREAISAINASLDIEQAYGKTLDLYGEVVGQPRGAATDEQYRVLLKNKINRNRAGADHNSIVNALCATFGCNPEDVLLTEDKPCTVKLEGLPAGKINENGIDVGTAVQIVASLLPVGIYLEAISFAGTFEFGGTELVYDENTGFADLEQTIGGDFGLVANNPTVTLPV